MLRDAGVTFLCVEAGKLYDSAHIEYDRFRNPNLDTIIKAAKQKNMPYGLYAEISGRTMEEADKEIYEIRLSVQKYTPEIGLWLTPHFTGTKEANDKLLQRYYDAFIKLGLEGKLGLYCSRSEISNITWSGKWCEKLLFWMDEHISDLSEIDRLLTPDFFMLNQ
jgi:hypothetical protein